MPGTTTDRLLRAALFLKGLDGAVELLAGLALLVVGPRELDGLPRWVVEHHLLGSPHGALAERFAAGEAALSGGDRTFAVLYLTLHGLVKLGLVVALLRQVLPAYPLAAGVLGVFCAYEVYRAVERDAWSMWAAAALDLAVVVLVLREYRRLRSRRRRAAGTAPRGGRPPRR
ncbi:putative membrane protein [Geodermatophilus normandii]|uniref:Putative membrane protein n=1 Tax=Geodermatophilus normandii TaxID=1137989 RepID=A0A317QEH6_9ACTN|nr:DUF2127 domain-containing protein [Geodermatophilus normandii]PWW20996.1 putative membrane protein [Geodermatophilus normandii]